MDASLSNRVCAVSRFASHRRLAAGGCASRKACRLLLAVSVLGGLAATGCTPKDDGKAKDNLKSKPAAKPANRIQELGRVAGDSTQWPLEEPRERDGSTPAATLGKRVVVEPIGFAFDYVQLVPAPWAKAEETPGVTPETMTIFDFVLNVHWDAHGLWLAERGGRPVVTLDTLVRGDGSTLSMTGHCGDLGLNRGAEPTTKAEPDFDAIHACAPIKTEGELIASVRGHIDLEFAPERIGYRLDKPETGDRIEGPVVAFVVEETGERKYSFSLDGDASGFWNVVGLDEAGKGIRITMVSNLGTSTQVTWQTQPVALRVEFAAAPQGSAPEGSTCDAGGRCTRRVDFEVPFGSLQREVTASDPKPPALAVAWPAAPEQWYAEVEPRLQETQVVSAQRVDEGYVVLRAIQSTDWLAPSFELWSPLFEGSHTNFGGVQWHVSSIGVEKSKRRAKGPDAWTAPAYTSPFFYGGGFTSSVGRVDAGRVVDFVKAGTETASVKTIEGELRFRTLEGETKVQAVPMGTPGVWSTDEGLQARLVRVSTRDAHIEMRGDIDRVAGVVFRDSKGEVFSSPRIYRGGGCMIPVEAKDSLNLCFATPGKGARSIELVTGNYKPGKKHKFRLEIE